MKCAIFCLLAFCAFQKVCTNNLEELENIRKEAVKNVENVEYKLHADVKAAWDVAHKKGIPYENLHPCANFLFEWDVYFVYPKVQDCEACQAKALKYMNVKYARTCCNEFIAVLERKAKSDFAFFNECVSKCFDDMKMAAKKGARKGQKKNKLRV